MQFWDRSCNEVDGGCSASRLRERRHVLVVSRDGSIQEDTVRAVIAVFLIPALTVEAFLCFVILLLLEAIRVFHLNACT